MYDPNDPGPVLKTYDPNWKARFDAKHGLLEELREIPVREQEPGLRSYLTGGLCEALLDQFKYKWEYEKFLREQYVPWFLGKEEGQIDFPIPSPPHTATPEQMEAHYKHWNEARPRSPASPFPRSRRRMGKRAVLREPCERIDARDLRRGHRAK